MKVNKNLIARIWKEADLKPRRLERYLASNDPQFEEKATAIIGLYLHPPQNAAVFCVDEKSAIQALDRLDRRLPLFPARPEKHGAASIREFGWTNPVLVGADNVIIAGHARLAARGDLG